MNALPSTVSPAPSDNGAPVVILPWQRAAFVAAQAVSRAVERARTALAAVTVDGGPGGTRVSMRDLFDGVDEASTATGLAAQSLRLCTTLTLLADVHMRSQVTAATCARAGRAAATALARGRMSDCRAQIETALTDGWAAVALAAVCTPTKWQALARALTDGTGITPRWLDNRVRAAVVRAHRDGLFPSPAVPALALIDDASRGWNEFLD